jgi:hypothetical protein
MIFTIQPNTSFIEGSSSQIPLSEFFPKRILHLSFLDIDGVSYESWPALKENILNAVINNSIELIIFDRTGDPVDLNNPTIYGYGPNDLTIRAELEKHCRCIIATDNFTYYYHPDPDVVFFPYNIWLLATQSIHKYYKFKHTVYDSTLEKTRPLMCLNRNLTWHRIFLFLSLIDKPWFDLMDYSFINILDRMHVDFLKIDLTDFEIGKMQQHAELFPIYLDYEKNCMSDPKKTDYKEGASSVNDPVHARNAINLVTETSLSFGNTLTEKTAKPFMAYQIPILIAPTGANQFLQDVGLDLFGDYVPWRSWDSITDQKVKINKIVEFLNQIMSTPDDLCKVHKSFHARLIKNKQYFHSDKFAQKLTEQIRNFKL